VYIAWSAHNRSSLIRVPVSREQRTRIELRSPDPSCNPYLTLAVLIRAGLNGIRREIQPPASIDRNIYDMTCEQRESLGIRSLPASLAEAVEALTQDPLIADTLGDHIYSHFVKAKRIESDVYRQQITDWEIRHYLSIF
jgi:glutamine synthetase